MRAEDREDRRFSVEQMESYARQAAIDAWNAAMAECAKQSDRPRFGDAACFSPEQVRQAVEEAVRAEREKYEEVLRDKNRLVRELDVIWNGEEGAAKQASLCDVVCQIAAWKRDQDAAPTAEPIGTTSAHNAYPRCETHPQANQSARRFPKTDFWGPDVPPVTDAEVEALCRSIETNDHDWEPLEVVDKLRKLARRPA